MTQRLEHAFDALEDYLYKAMSIPSRDPREPGRAQKHKAESRLQAVVMRHFRKQRAAILARLESFPPMQAQKAALQYNFDDLLEDSDAVPGVTRIILQSVLDGVELSGQRFPVTIDYTLSNAKAAAWAREYAGELIDGVDKTTLDIVRSAIGQFVDKPGTTIGDVVAQLPFDEQRALSISVTEITRSYAQADLIAGQQLQEEFPDIPVVKTWFTNNDDLVCPICAPFDGMEVALEKPFHSDVNGEDFDAPPGHVNCLTGDALITPISRVPSLGAGISALSMRHYDGDVVVIHTAGKRSLTCTPNHPILTSKGWVSASLLDVGSDVIACSLGDGILPGDIDNQYMPTCFKDIAKAFGSSFEVFTKPVKVTSPDFHYDGIGSNVAVIYSNRLLGDSFDPTLPKHIGQDGFVSRDMQPALLNKIGVCNTFGQGALTPTGSVVSGGDLSGPGPDVHVLPLERFGLGLIANVNTALDQSTPDSPTVDIQIMRDFILRHTSGVFTDDVVSIERKTFRGHVYNLQSESGTYIANGIITHNCRCWTEVTTNLDITKKDKNA